MTTLGFNKNQITHILIMVLSIGYCIVIFFPFMSVLCLAGIFAFVLYPFIFKLQKTRWASHRKFTLIILFLLFLLITIPFGIVGGKIYGLMKEFATPSSGKEQFINRFSEQATLLKTQVSHHLETFGLSESFDGFFSETTQKVASFIFNFLSGMIAAIPDFAVGLFIFLIALFYFLTESQKIGNFFQETKLLS